MPAPRGHRSKFPTVPYAGIEFIVNRYHVGAPDVEVMADIATRAHVMAHRPACEVVEWVRHALACHAYNRDTYRFVMGGIR